MKKNMELHMSEYWVEEYGYSLMPKCNYERPAQIPIRKKRFDYLMQLDCNNQTNPDWIMFRDSNHFVIFDRRTKFCIFDAEYLTFFRHKDCESLAEDEIVAVISRMVINKDESQIVWDGKNDFCMLAELITEKL